MHRVTSLLVLLGVGLGWGASAHAKDIYATIPLQEVKFDNNKTWKQVGRFATWTQRRRLQRLSVHLIGGGKAFLEHRYIRGKRGYIRQLSLLVRLPNIRALQGWMLIPAPGSQNEMNRHGFRVSKQVVQQAVTSASRNQYYHAKEQYYLYLLSLGVPGAAWFRYQIHRAREAQDKASRSQTPLPYLRRSYTRQHAYSMFSGGRAVSENLQLRAILSKGKTSGKMIPLHTVRGIRVTPYNFKQHIKSKTIALDPLSGWIPADQHVAFFASLTTAREGIRELMSYGSQVMGLAAQRSEEESIMRRYMVQLSLSPEALAKHAVARNIGQIAVTGSDPYFILGTDVAVLFQTPNPAAVQGFFSAAYQAVVKHSQDARLQQGKIEGLTYAGVTTPDRRVSSYCMSLGKAVVVTNSLAQLTRLVHVYRRNQASLRQLDEYKFFRMRYPVEHSHEKAFLVLSDATIRRWGSPEWRIAASRRHYVAGVLAALQARHLADPTWSKDPQTLKQLPWTVVGSGRFVRTQHHFRSTVYGSLAFMTPLSEIRITHATEGEVDSYQQWRTSYEREWRGVFDPIAFRLTVQGRRVEGDLSVVPLIGNSRYRRWVDVMQGVSVQAGDGGQRNSTVGHLILSLNVKRSRLLQMWDRIVTGSTGISPLSWLGQHISISLDASPFWQKWMTSKAPEKFLQENPYDLPVVVAIAVQNPTLAQAFMQKLRQLSQQHKMQHVTWTDLRYQGHLYTEIATKMRYRRKNRWFRLYYTLTKRHLVLTPVLSSLQQVIQREQARISAQPTTLPGKAGEQPTSRPIAQISALLPDRAWFTRNFAVQWGKTLMQLTRVSARRWNQQKAQQLAWLNIPILNEWRRLFPQKDPLAVHRHHWQRRLSCPGGGTYRWNAAYQTMESTRYGHPAQPKIGPTLPDLLPELSFVHFGVSFEMGGLRAKVVLHRSQR